MNKSGIEGLNKYFALNKKILLITAGSGVFCTGLGMICNAASNDDRNKYHNERGNTDDMLQYKEKSKRELVWGYIFGGAGVATLGFSSYYFVNYILKIRVAKTKFAYDPQTSSFVWRF